MDHKRKGFVVNGSLWRASFQGAAVWKNAINKSISNEIKLGAWLALERRMGHYCFLRQL